MSRGPPQDPKCKLFVGGLDPYTTEENLKTYFEKYGDVQVKLNKNPDTGKSRGFAFLTFNSVSNVDKAQSERPHKIDGKSVGTKRVLPKDEYGMADNSQVKKLFVGGIRGNVEEEDIRKQFGEYGKIVTVHIPSDKESGKQKGFIFIEFDDPDAVDKACQYKDDIKISGKHVGVSKAYEKDQMGYPVGGGGGGSRSGYGGSGGGGGGYGGGYDDGYDSYGGYGAYDDGYKRQSSRSYGPSNGGYGRGRSAYGRSSNGYGDGYDSYGGGYDDGYDSYGSYGGGRRGGGGYSGYGGNRGYY
ncbi:unnamed protein product [Meganyctiphanes norvegica]|uniref:RRM domain-containing protein n=1 Tax=Meganyctiphanes norvegica TaxID=48144 RepID=A0AAV2QGZ4_MEGNR